MPVFITSLNSGSNGNCYYVGNENEAILVDVGISCREVERRMQRLGLDMHKLRAIFISHEHSDHISGLAVTANKYKLPVYITGQTFRSAGLRIGNELVISFNAVLPVVIGNLSVKAFQKYHDATDPHSFVVSSSSGVSVGVFTDIGNPCKELVYHFRQCHAAFLESNYDEEMLMNGKYPYFLKKRIRGGLGHLSNAQAFQLFVDHRPEYMTHLLLAHLSKENNCPKLVEELFRSNAGDTHIIVASRYQETPVFEIRENGRNIGIKSLYPQQQTQLSLF
ncbi:MAG: MBL fold metallo-hydrolase [Chitinophagaceae bacterium]|nr:MBL fold metallo-hydrolase [Chitinophagaceae bacterium]